MQFVVSSALVICIVFLLLTAGCADIKATQKVGDFGTAFGASLEEQKAIDWFKTSYGDPTTNNDQPPHFVEPMITSGISDKNLPVDKVTTFPVNGGSVYFFVIYDNFKRGDPISVNWTYLENGREVTHVQQQAGGDFGRFIVEFQKPDSGWGKGKQRITITGDGKTTNVEFALGDSLQTTPLPYNSSAGAAGQSTGAVMLPITTLTTVTTVQPAGGGTEGPTETPTIDPKWIDSLKVTYGYNCTAILRCSDDYHFPPQSNMMTYEQWTDVCVKIGDDHAQQLFKTFHECDMNICVAHSQDFGGTDPGDRQNCRTNVCINQLGACENA